MISTQDNSRGYVGNLDAHMSVHVYCTMWLVPNYNNFAYWMQLLHVDFYTFSKPAVLALQVNTD